MKYNKKIDLFGIYKIFLIVLHVLSLILIICLFVISIFGLKVILSNNQNNLSEEEKENTSI